MFRFAIPPPSFGAGCQCRYPYSCPDFVLCLEFVHYVSSLCPIYVHVLNMTSICLQNPSFVLIKSCFCPRDPIFVLFLSFLLAQIDLDKNQSKFGFHYFPICHLVTLQLDKYWTFSRLREVPSLSTNCPINSPEIQVYQSIRGLDISWTNTRYKNHKNIQTLSTATLCLKIVQLTKWAVTHGPPTTHCMPT